MQHTAEISRRIVINNVQQITTINNPINFTVSINSFIKLKMNKIIFVSGKFNNVLLTFEG